MWKLAVALGVLCAIGLVLFLPQDGDIAGPFRLLGTYEIPTAAWSYGRMPVAELSGIAYDLETDRYYAVSDDRGDLGTPGRIYTLEIDLDRRGIHDVRVVDVSLLDHDIDTAGVQPHERGTLDAEEILLTPGRELIVSSERDAENRPWIRRYAEDGILLNELPIPDPFLPGPGKGVRPNLGFEGMALSADGATLHVANEQALVQDGPLATPERGTNVRILRIDLTLQTPSVTSAFVYVADPVFAAPEGDYADNGVTAMLDVTEELPAFDLLVVERAYSSGIGNDIRLYGVSFDGAEDVAAAETIPAPFLGTTAHKTLLLRLSALQASSDFPIVPDNMEGLCWGPPLGNGHRTLLLISDNNFSDSQRNLFIALELVP